jgi:hypothetical protein
VKIRADAKDTASPSGLEEFCNLLVHTKLIRSRSAVLNCITPLSGLDAISDKYLKACRWRRRLTLVNRVIARGGIASLFGLGIPETNFERAYCSRQVSLASAIN